MNSADLVSAFRVCNLVADTHCSSGNGNERYERCDGKLQVAVCSHLRNTYARGREGSERVFRRK